MDVGMKISIDSIQIDVDGVDIVVWMIIEFDCLKYHVVHSVSHFVVMNR